MLEDLISRRNYYVGLKLTCFTEMLKTKKGTVVTIVVSPNKSRIKKVGIGNVGSGLSVGPS